MQPIGAYPGRAGCSLPLAFPLALFLEAPGATALCVQCHAELLPHATRCFLHLGMAAGAPKHHQTYLRRTRRAEASPEPALTKLQRAQLPLPCLLPAEGRAGRRPRLRAGPAGPNAASRGGQGGAGGRGEASPRGGPGPGSGSAPAPARPLSAAAAAGCSLPDPGRALLCSAPLGSAPRPAASASPAVSVGVRGRAGSGGGAGAARHCALSLIAPCAVRDRQGPVPALK